jgi:DNA replication and repair protein RecF
MFLTKITLSSFRNFKGKTIKFSPGRNVIVGPNASGKTNILESIFLLSTGKSFHARIEEEMVNYEEELSRVRGGIVGEEEEKPVGTNLEVVLTRGEITIGSNPEKTSKIARKKLLINGVAKRLIDFAGNLRTVLFGPWDLELVTEEPSKRRKFLDIVLSQVDREYRRAILSYEKGLRQRNRLLWRIREEGVSRTQLLFWNKLLIKNGDYISQRRRDFIEFANVGNFQFPRLRRGYGGQAISQFQLDYDPSAISESRLEQYANEEIAAASTLVGPHRDDFVFILKNEKTKKLKNERELAPYGSRGEQRMGVLWLKLAELSFIESTTGEKPILLLDDIFSELDHEHRSLVNKVSQNQQTIITTADPHFVEHFEIDSLIKL